MQITDENRQRNVLVDLELYKLTKTEDWGMFPRNGVTSIYGHIQEANTIGPDMYTLEFPDPKRFQLKSDDKVLLASSKGALLDLRLGWWWLVHTTEFFGYTNQ
jgi:hypothetical protein